MRSSSTLITRLLPIAVAILSTGVAHAQLPAFSGADGAGQFASGGRGGIVYHVTQLNFATDDTNRTNSGTLLYGLTDAHFPAGVPRTIVFDVAGVFHLGHLDRTNWVSNGNAWDSTSRQGINSSSITLAGQTAPGPVIIMGGTFKPNGTNQIFRNITIAAGFGMKGFWEPPPKTPPATNALPTSFSMEAFNITGQNIMIDHVDTVYCSDEAIDVELAANNVTVQYCNVSQGQNYNRHAFGQWLRANTDQKISFLHNLTAHQATHMPRVGGDIGTGSQNDLRNNVFYNWNFDSVLISILNSRCGYGGGFENYSSKNNFIHNFYLVGDGGDASATNTTPGGSLIFSGYQSYGSATISLFRTGNVADSNHDGDPFDAVAADAAFSDCTFLSSAYDVKIGVTLDAATSFTNVLRYAGSRWWERDIGWPPTNAAAIGSNEITERIVYETYTGTGRNVAWADNLFNTNDTEGVEWRALWALRADTNGVAPFNRPAGWDTDGDGMPDAWESEHGLDPNVANNNGDFDNDGYTDLEEYLHDVAAWPAPGDIIFTGNTNNRYALIYNWKVTGRPVNISGLGVVTTSSLWQPSRYDTAIISNTTVVVDAVGQHAGILRLTNNATLNITNGWLKVAQLDIGPGCTLILKSNSTFEVTGNFVNNGTLRLTGAALLNAGGTFTNNGVMDLISWTGTLPVGAVNNGSVLAPNLNQISAAEVSGTDFGITIQGYANHNYQLQYRDSLTSGVWSNIGAPVTGTDAPLTLTHSGGVGSVGRFYRVAID